MHLVICKSAEAYGYSGEDVVIFASSLLPIVISNGTQFVLERGPTVNSLMASPLTRRSILLGIPIAAMLLLKPELSSAIEVDEFDALCEMTVGEYLRARDADTYCLLDDDLRELLDESPMLRGQQTRAYMNQSVSINAWNNGGGSVGYRFTFSCSESCSSLYALVTIGSYQKAFWGSGAYLSGSGIASGLARGTYSVVVTAFSPNPPTGSSSAYSQDWTSVTI